MKFYAIVPAVLVALALGGCRGNDSGQAARAVANTAKAQENQDKAIEDATYISSCESANLPNIGDLVFPKAQTEIHLSNLNFNKKQIYYADADCKNPSFVIDNKGTLDVREKSEAAPEAMKRDFHYDTTAVTINSESIVKVFNALGICGYKDWAVGVEKNVTPEAVKASCPGKATPRTAFEITAIENGNLVMGGNAEQENEAERPKELDKGRVYTRK